MRIALAPAVTGELHLHQGSAQTILQIVPQDSLFDEHRALGGRPFIVEVERTAARRQGAIVDDRAQLGRDSLSETAGESGRLATVEVGFQTVPDCLVQQDTRPPGSEHDIHRSSGRIDGLEIDDGLTHGLPGMRAALVRIEAVGDTRAAPDADVAGLAALVRFCNTPDIEAHERLDITDGPPLRRGDQHDLALDRQ